MRETVNIIPQKTSSDNLSEMRNISCTPLLAKIIEFFVLKRIRSEITIKSNQFGGIPGCGTDHYLVETWNAIMESLDQESSVCSIVSVDFAKAFNTMSHQACVKELKKKGASKHMVKPDYALQGRE